MNQTQFNLVKTFIAMGNTPYRIAREWGVDITDVTKAASSASYKQYKTEDDFNIGDFMKGMAGL